MRVIVGKSVPADQSAKCFGFVPGYDQKAKLRVTELLSQQGVQGNHRVVFLSDGAANLRQLQNHLTPNAQHILDCRAAGAVPPDDAFYGITTVFAGFD